MKKIILGLPQTFSLYAAIKKNLEFHGFEVIDISYPNHTFKYKNFRQRIVNALRKVFLKDKHYKNTLIFNHYKKEILQTLHTIETPTDYALLIRADVYPKGVLKLIKQKTKKMVAYHWDGLDRFPQIYDYLKYFKRFFVFDSKDLKKTELALLPTTNFAFDYDSNIQIKAPEYDVFFIGSFLHQRMHKIEYFIKKATSLNQKVNFIIHYSEKIDSKKFPLKEIKYTDTHLTYQENIKHLKNATIVIDFLNETHHGLSFRTFEAMYYGKKLITNNPLIKEYEFYHPNNIFVWDGENLEGYEAFSKIPFSPIAPKLIEKYSFKNWINYILDIKPYIPIIHPD